MSTLEERVTAERAAQGLPPKVQNRDVLDQVAAILLDATAGTEHQAEKGGGGRARAS
jgi:hypothetical protein